MAKILPKIKQPVLNKSFVSISKAAKFLRLSPDTLRNWEKEGKLLPSRTAGGARRYSRAELISLKKETRPFTRQKKGLISISQAAKALKVSADTLRNWDKKGLVESSRSRGGARRFTRNEISRLQKELGLKVSEVPAEEPKISHEVPKFDFPWLKITFSAAVVIFISATGLFFVSLIDPLERRLNDTSKIMAEAVKSIEVLQQGVLGIQTQLIPSPTTPPSNPPTTSANYGEGRVFVSAEAPLTLDLSSGIVRCASCLTKDSPYISVLTNSDGTLTLSLDNKTATISLSLDHANTWSTLQTFTGGIGIGTKSSPVVITSAGNVGIGWTSPVNKLEVVGAQTIGAGYAGMYTAPANGLLVQGNVGINISAPSYRLDVGGGARFSCGSDTWGSGPATSCSDIAEVYESDGSVGAYEIVAIGKKSGIVTRSESAYQQGLLGVYSTSPGILVGGETILGGSSNLADRKIPVALSGRALVKVSDENGPIGVGDYLTSSSIAGVAMKATKPGSVLGQALEAFEVSEDVSPSSEETEHLIYFKAKIKKILVFVNVSFADPGNFLASLGMDDAGNLIIPRIISGSIMLDSSLAQAASQLSVTNTQLSIKTDPDFTSPGPVLAYSDKSYIDLSGEIASLESRIQNSEFRIKELETDNMVQQTQVRNLQDILGSVGIGLTAQISEQLGITQIASESASQSTSDSGSLTIRSSDTLTASESSELLSPSDSLNLSPPDILFATSSATLSDLKVTDTLSSDKLFTAYDGKISGDLRVFGKTTLGSTIIAGDLNVGGTLSITSNSINVIGADDGIFYIQNSSLATSLDFFNGLVTIDKQGNLKAQTVTVAAFKVIANRISGSGKIVSGTKSVDIENTQVSPNSRILITPNAETNLVLAVTDKLEGKKFTVSAAQAVPQDIIFDWFLINESDF